MDLSKDEKIRKVKACYEKVKNEHTYFSYLNNKQRALLVQDELPIKPIYEFSSIFMFLSGHFTIKAEYKEIVDKIVVEVKSLPIDNPNTTSLVLEIIDRLPTKPIYDINTIIQINSGTYK